MFLSCFSPNIKFMLPRIDPTQTNAWKQLTQHADRLKTQRIESLFASSSQRARRFSARLGEIHFDYSKNLLDEEALAALIDLADQCRLSEAVFSMRSGNAINETEQRAVCTPHCVFLSMRPQRMQPRANGTRRSIRFWSKCGCSANVCVRASGRDSQESRLRMW